MKMNSYSLKGRLISSISLTFLLIWGCVFGWLYFNLEHQLNQTLDERLSASAHMVARLLQQIPMEQLTHKAETLTSETAQHNQIACEVSLFSSDISIDSQVLARTRGAPVHMQANTPGYHSWQENGVEWRSYVLKKGELQVIAAEKVQLRQMLLTNILQSILVPLALTLIVCIILILWIIRSEFKLVDQFSAELTRHKHERLHEQLYFLSHLDPKQLPQEIYPFLNNIFDLVQKLQESLENEKNFSAYAAHELRSPLTAIKTHVQLCKFIAEQQGAAPALIKNLLAAEENVSRYQKFLEQLLILSQTELHQVETSDTVRVGIVLEQVIKDLEQVYPGAAQRIARLGALDTEVRISPAALAIVLKNIIENALKYAQSEQPVEVSMQGPILTITDYGVGLKPDELNLATRRFWRKGAQNEGHGLGLALTQVLLQQFGHSIKIEHNQPQGLKIRLIFNTKQSFQES